MSDADAVNADMQSFWNGVGGHTWVARQAHTDITLQQVADALLAYAAPKKGESVLDVGCGCGASTLDFARAVGPTGSVVALDVSGPMLEEARTRSASAGIAHVDWQQADAASTPLGPYDLLTSMFGLMFFGDPIAAFTHMRQAAREGARMAFVAWRSLDENPWMGVPMDAVRPHLPPRPAGRPNAPGMFALADPDYVTEVLTSAGWSPPGFEALDCALDIAAGRGLEAAVVQSTQIGAVNSWLRSQPDEVVAASTDSIREALTPYVEGESVRLPGAMWLVRSTLP
jgi:SAM-dependent methyltransferase